MQIIRLNHVYARAQTMVNVEGKSGTRRPYEELFGHLSFVLLGAAYLTRDVITLRCVAVGGLSAAVVFQYFRPAPLWLPLRWNLLFVGINAVWVGRLWWEEHLAHLEITEVGATLVHVKKKKNKKT